MRNSLSIAWVIVSGILFLFVNAGAMAAGSSASGQTKAAACMACHGQDGNSLADMWPKLAGQLPEYIVKQLQDFKAGRRSNEQMSPMAQPLTEQDMADLAAYFSSQKATPGEGKKELLAQGEKLFNKGRPQASVVIACVGCHGLGGSGNRQWSKAYSNLPTVLAPAIGGQHPAYVVKQLKAFRDKERANDVGNTMRNIAGRLDDKEIAAVAEYIATLSY
ncbi:MAG: cytochrome c4 [Betaproteobacteria bacterium]|nr:cytochrome c4 [Betaproteobacteria bacterium]